MFTHSGNRKKVNCLGFWGKHWLLLCLLWGNRTSFCLGCFICSLAKPCFWTAKRQSFQIFAKERMAAVLSSFRPRSTKALKWMTFVTLNVLLCVSMFALAIIWAESPKQSYMNYFGRYSYSFSVEYILYKYIFPEASGDELHISIQITHAKFTNYY